MLYPLAVLLFTFGLFFFWVLLMSLLDICKSYEICELLVFVFDGPNLLMQLLNLLLSPPYFFAELLNLILLFLYCPLDLIHL